MQTSRNLLRILIVVAALIPPSTAKAQDSDADWLDDCRSGHGDRYGRS
ncbi:MAG TPA: hypothetical protein VFT21_02175 [Gemmatimonadaceae bacterium]|nr:hypothetical protein [Gemmatimonadaceae bacterium]